MKFNFFKKTLCTLCCACMLLPHLASCNKTPSEPVAITWEAKEEQVVSLDMTLNKGENETTLTITSGEDVFSSIKNEQIKLVAFQYTATEEDTSNAEVNFTSKQRSITEATITNFTIKVDNKKQLTITAPNGENYIGFGAFVHSSAMSNGKYGEAIAYIESENTSESQKSISTKLSGEYALGDVNPTITVAVENATISKGFNKDMLSLSGLFEALTITEAAANGNVITVKTEGTIPYATPFVGGIELSKDATEAGVASIATIDILYRTAHVEQKSFTFEKGLLSFKVVLASDTVSLSADDTITENGVTYTVKAVSEDKTAVTFTTAVDVAGLDEAIAKVDGNTFFIPADKTASGDALCILVYSNEASISAYIDYIESTHNNTYKATLYLLAKNGEWAGEITAADLSFGDEFGATTVESIKKNDDGYEVVISFVKEGIELEELALVSTVSVAESKVKNLWGTIIKNGTAELTYIAIADRDLTDDELIKFVKENKNDFNTIWSIGKTLSGINITDISGTAANVNKILVLAGVIQKKEKTTLESLKAQLEDIQRSVAALDKKLDSIRSSVSNNFSGVISEVHFNTYLTANASWNNFISDYVKPLLDMVTSYKNAYKEYILNYIGKAHTNEGAINVYIDSNGKITIPHPINNTYAIDGTTLASSGSYRLSKELTTVSEKVMANRGRLYDGYWEDIENAISKIVGVGSGTGNKLSKEDFLLALQTSAAIYALNKVGADNILGAYTNFCMTLSGKNSPLVVKPLDNYMTILSTYYNFFGEAREDIKVALAWLSGILVETTGIASFAYEFSPSAEENIISEAFASSVDTIDACASIDLGDHFSFIANRKLLPIYTMPTYPDNKTLKMSVLGNKMWEDTVLGSTALDDSVMVDGTYATDVQVSMMFKRYENLKKRGATSAVDFGEYLVSSGILSKTSHFYWRFCYDNLKPAIVTSPAIVEAIKKDNKTSLPVAFVESSTWVKVGDMIKVGSNGKLSKSHFICALRIKGDVFYMDGRLAQNTEIDSCANYYENHLWWRTPEEWNAGNNLEHFFFFLRYV